MTVAILGCGPTGLIAAHACATKGVGFVILSKKRKSQLYGSQYLHEPIPNIIDEDEGEPVKYINIGTPDQYRWKTHGQFWDGIVAPEDFETDHKAWNIRAAYERMWRHYNQNIIDYSIPMRTNGLLGDPDYSMPHPATAIERDLDANDNFELIISTVPRKIWATHGEEYVYSTGWAMGDAPEDGRFVPYEIADMTIHCNGRPEVAYNRLSRVFGYATVEWPAGANLNEIPDGATSFLKPLRYHWDHNGPPSPVNNDRWMHVGRYGRWMKGVVVTDAWHDVLGRLTAIGYS